MADTNYLKPAARYAWIRKWLADQSPRGQSAMRVDVLCSDFVYGYIEATGAQAKFQMVGAPSCPQLGRDLGAMFKAGILKRHTTGLPAGDAAMGFPKWVWSYRLSPAVLHELHTAAIANDGEGGACKS